MNAGGISTLVQDNMASSGKIMAKKFNVRMVLTSLTMSYSTIEHLMDMYRIFLLDIIA